VEESGNDGVGITNYGFDGIAIKQGEQYDFSAFIKNLYGNTLSFEIKLLGKKGDTLALQSFPTDSSGWKKYTATFTPSAGDDSSSFAILCKTKGKFAIDMVSLFPQNTFHNEANGLRADIAQTIAELHPKFIRFPGGCLVHGDGLGNMYRWKNTIGSVEERVEQKNIWNYHQTVGLGFYEYFRFCEDISAKPLPIVAAAVSCQNSGGTWRVGGIGQKAIPLNEMPQYIQDVLDLIEYANGPATSKWGAKRAAAGHPEPFHLQYIGVGNEDKQTDDFRERFKLIYDAVKAVYPDVTVVGTAGPFYKGEDFELGWQFAGKLNVPVVDEHYYEKPEWFLGNQHRYDNYDRKKSKVYVGEFASLGNTLFNALAEAAYMISLERNGDVVVMSSYAPLLANKNHASWSPDLIFFNNTTVVPTVNYYVQQLFSVNAGDHYYSNVISFNQNDSLLAASCVTNANEDIILKIVNAGSSPCKASINLKNFKSVRKAADGIMLTGKPGEQNTFQDPAVVTPKNFKMDVNKSFTYDVAAYSFTVIRIKN
jgi:alpha-L-arabinofuranosidase